MFIKYKKVSQLNKNQYFRWGSNLILNTVNCIFDFISRKREKVFNTEKSKLLKVLRIYLEVSI